MERKMESPRSSAPELAKPAACVCPQGLAVPSPGLVRRWVVGGCSGACRLTELPLPKPVGSHPGLMGAPRVSGRGGAWEPCRDEGRARLRPGTLLVTECRLHASLSLWSLSLVGSRYWDAHLQGLRWPPASARPAAQCPVPAASSAGSQAGLCSYFASGSGAVGWPEAAPPSVCLWGHMGCDARCRCRGEGSGGHWRTGVSSLRTHAGCGWWCGGRSAEAAERGAGCAG